jgi:hypothetical protein
MSKGKGNIKPEEVESMLVFLEANGPCSVYDLMEHLDRSEGGVRGILTTTPGIHYIPGGYGERTLYTYKAWDENTIVLPCGGYIDYGPLFEKLRNGNNQ